MSCITKAAKYIIFTFNFIIAVCAIILIAFGVIYVVDESDGVNVFDGGFSLGALAISVGVIIFFIAAFGCCGAINESTCLLTIYAVILILLFILQTVLGVLAVVKIQDENDFFKHIKDLIQDLFNKEDSSSIKSFHTLQAQFSCCGVNNYTDYTNIETDGYPSSCCKKELTPCFQPYSVGCASAYTDAIKNNIVIIGYVAIGFAVIELAGAIFAFIVRKRQFEYV